MTSMKEKEVIESLEEKDKKFFNEISSVANETYFKLVENMSHIENDSEISLKILMLKYARMLKLIDQLELLKGIKNQRLTIPAATTHINYHEEFGLGK